MYITVDQATFVRQFEAYGRADQFSYEALEALFEYYDELEDCELDVIAICCDWTEYEDMEEAINNYWDYDKELDERLPEECQSDYLDEWHEADDEEKEDMDEPRDATDDEMEEAKDKLEEDFLEYLNDRTSCITLSEGILVLQF